MRSEGADYLSFVLSFDSQPLSGRLTRLRTVCGLERNAIWVLAGRLFSSRAKPFSTIRRPARKLSQKVIKQDALCLLALVCWTLFEGCD